MVLPALVPVAAVAAVDPGGYAPFGSAKWLAVTVLVLAAAAVALARGAVVAERRTLWLWVALLGWVTLSALVGLDRWYALLGTPERHAGVVLWVLCALAFVVGQRAAVYRLHAERLANGRPGVSPVMTIEEPEAHLHPQLQVLALEKS